MEEEIVLSEEQQATVDKLSTFLANNEVVIFDSLTDVTLKGGRKNPLQGRVSRLLQNQQAKPNINGLFAKLVNESNQEKYQQALSEGQEVEEPTPFEPAPRRWGTTIADGILYHKGQLYVSLLPFYTEDVDTGTTVLIDSKPTKNPEEIEGFPEPSPSQESNVYVRMYNLRNLINIRNDKGEVLKINNETGLIE